MLTPTLSRIYPQFLIIQKHFLILFVVWSPPGHSEHGMSSSSSNSGVLGRTLAHPQDSAAIDEYDPTEEEDYDDDEEEDDLEEIDDPTHHNSG